MSALSVMNGDLRADLGKGASRAVRRSGRIPAVIYGGGGEPVHFTLEPVQLHKQLHQSGFYSKIFDLKIGSKSERGLARDVQFHPVTDLPLHVDFVRVQKGGKINVYVPLNFINEEASPGMKRGGVLNICVHSLEMSCDVDHIPESIDVDLAGLNIHETIHLDGLNLPKGSTPLHPERDHDIVNIVAPTVLKDEAAGETEAAAEEVKETKETKE